MIAVGLSLAAAMTFALSAMMVSSLHGKVGLFQAARWQMSIAFVMTAATSVLLGGWRSIDGWQFAMLAGSSVAGIMLATTTYFAAIYAIGPRITALLFALAAPFALLLGYVFLGETINAAQGAGVALILAGIVLAVSQPESAALEQRKGLWRGVVLGVITALGQATGSLLARPAMMAGAEPFTAMAIRSGLGAVFFILLALLPFGQAARALRPAEWRMIALSAFFGMFLGMSLLMAALARGDVGIVTTLSSTTPVLILPLIWLSTGKAPGLRAWVGALLAVAGTALISMAAV